MDPFHLGGDGGDVASSSVLRTGIQTLAALGGGDLLLFQVTWCSFHSGQIAWEKNLKVGRFKYTKGHVYCMIMYK